MRGLVAKGSTRWSEHQSGGAGAAAGPYSSRTGFWVIFGLYEGQQQQQTRPACSVCRLDMLAGRVGFQWSRCVFKV